MKKTSNEEKKEDVHKLDKKVHVLKIYFWLWLHMAETILKYYYLSFFYRHWW